MESITTRSRRRRLGTALMAGVAGAALLTLAACGGGSGGGSSTSAPTTSAAPTSSSAPAPTSSGADPLAAFEAKVGETVAKRSALVLAPPPADGPKGATGKKVFIIACVMAAEGCARETRSADEAAKALGWDSTVIDTESVPDKMVAAVDQAIAAKADGIIIQAIDMETLAAPLQKAKDAGIKVICFACANYNGLADQTIPAEADFEADGYALAAEMYQLTDGHPRLIGLVDAASFKVVGMRWVGTEKFFAECQAAGGDCQIVKKEDVLVTELTTRVPEVTAALVKQFPEANAIWMPYDSASSFIQQGLQAAGADKTKIRLYGFDANAANIADIRADGFQAASIAGPFEWVGWAEIDGLNRLFNGQAPVDGVVGFRIIDKANIPATDNWEGDVPFKDDYKKVWGVS